MLHRIAARKALSSRGIRSYSVSPANIPKSVRIVEVGPRDGLQNERGKITTETKIELIERLASAGLVNIEAGAFVKPEAIPQMADTSAVLDSVMGRLSGVGLPVLVPNLRGLDQAIKANVKEIAIFTAASEAFTKKNIRKTIKESLEVYEKVVKQALENDIKVRGYVSCVVGCPYEGSVAPEKVAEVSAVLADMGCYEISLGDTIGVGTPASTIAMLSAVSKRVPISKLAVHCHDTYGQALANIYASLQMGVSVVDSSVAGLGGCPYAKGASGNVATEDVVYMLQGLSVDTGVNMDKLVDTGDWISQKLNRAYGSKAGLALHKKREK